MNESITSEEAGMRGLTARMLRGPRFERVTYGLYAPNGSMDELATRCRALTRVLPPEGVFSHYTSARLREWALPALPDWLPLFASLPDNGTHIHRNGLYVARTVAAREVPDVRDGVHLATAGDTLTQLAQDLSLLDLIAVLDSALHLRDTTPDDLERSIRPYQPGGGKLRRALRFADGRAESWWETALRLLHTWSGIEVEPQHRVYDDWGALIARGDLWIVGTRRLHEYDGEHHDRPKTRHGDLARDKALARIDWDRYGYIARDLVRGPDSILRDAETALGLPHRPQRLRRWHAEAARSSLSAAGRASLERRLRRYWRWRRPDRQPLAQERR